MRRGLTVLTFSLRELARSYWILTYALFFAAISWTLVWFGQDPTQVVASLLEVVIIVVPLVSLVVATVQFYNCRDHAELLLTQPISRASVFAGQFSAVAGMLSFALLVGIVVPFLYYGSTAGSGVFTLLLLLLAGLFLTVIFSAIAFIIAVRTENRLRALGFALGIWLMFGVVYDGLLLVLIMALPSYQLTAVLLGLSMLNPIDLARLLVLLRLDVAALMGATAAVFKEFLGSTQGIVAAMLILGVWSSATIFFGAKAYIYRDF